MLTAPRSPPAPTLPRQAASGTKSGFRKTPARGPIRSLYSATFPNVRHWIDQEGTVVNGDCYWLTARSKKQEELLWLALAVSNSTFIEAFYDHYFNNKLYSGRRRFITQYVERFPLPDPTTALARQMVALSKKIYHLTPSLEARPFEEQLDALVWKAFGLSVEKIGR